MRNTQKHRRSINKGKSRQKSRETLDNWALDFFFSDFDFDDCVKLFLFFMHVVCEQRKNEERKRERSVYVVCVCV